MNKFFFSKEKKVKSSYLLVASAFSNVHFCMKEQMRRFREKIHYIYRGFSLILDSHLYVEKKIYNKEEINVYIKETLTVATIVYLD